MEGFSIDYLRKEMEQFSLSSLQPPLNAKAELAAEKNIYASADELTEKLTSGSFSVKIDDVDFECFCHIGEKNNIPPPAPSLCLLRFSTYSH